jgi:hypothetical protein
VGRGHCQGLRQGVRYPEALCGGRRGHESATEVNSSHNGSETTTDGSPRREYHIVVLGAGMLPQK